MRRFRDCGFYGFTRENNLNMFPDDFGDKPVGWIDHIDLPDDSGWVDHIDLPDFPDDFGDRRQ